MSKEEKMLSAFSNIIYIKEGVRVAPKDLKSTKADNVLPESTIELIRKYEPYFEKIEEIVEFIDDIRNPTGIYRFMQDYALANGTQYQKEVKFLGRGGEVKEVKLIDDYYVPNNDEEYVMIIIDHISLIDTEKEDGRRLSPHASITKLSSKYLVSLRNKYKYIPIVIQQQAAASESLESMKANKLKPSMNDLGDCKLTARDANTIFGLFSPFRHEIKTYFGYDVSFFKDNIRFLELLGGREGGAGTVCPLYFDGAVNFFKELPLPTELNAIQKVLNFIKKIRNEIKHV